MTNEIGRVEKGPVTFVEYGDLNSFDSKHYFVQVGIAGLHLTEKELKDLYTVLGYYINITDYAECKVKIEGEYVAIS